MSINVIVIEGRLVADAIVKTTVNGKPYTSFRIAHNAWNKAEQKEEPKFFTVKTYREMPLTKGTLIIAKGVLDFFEYEKDGEKKSIVYISAYEVMQVSIIKKENPQEDMVKNVFSMDIPF